MRHPRIRSLSLLLFVLAVLSAPLAVQPATAAAPTAKGRPFVQRVGATLRLNGRPFRFAGSNNYYLMYQSPAAIDHLLETAAASGFDVIRMWGSLDIGNQDGSNSINGKANGIYFQYFDPALGRPTYNDGDDGLKRLDYVIHKAGQLNLRLVIPFVNNWNNFGGMDQYVRWRGGSYHDDFYTDPLIRQWYKDWIAHLLNRTNSYNGIKYKNDPTIMTWELANEPRCLSAGAYPRSANCTTETLIRWADDVSHYINRIDRNHLISVGDEGFYCQPSSPDWIDNCGEGVDTLAFARLKHIDVMSLHLYPDGWGKDVAWGTDWIARHARDARAIGKPVMLGEFGLLDKSTRNTVYREWTDMIYRSGINGALYWILSDRLEDGSYYPDYDGFTVYCPSPVCQAFSNFGEQMAGTANDFAPVADHDSAVTEFATDATLNPAANDIAYGNTTIVSTTIDLDPAAAGRQTSASSAGGSFTLQSDQTVDFTPAAGFVGKASIHYTVQDSRGRLSNVADLTVTVKPDPTAALQLYSFEDGTEGWNVASWEADKGSVAQSNAFATAGSSSLAITSNGAWFGLELGSMLEFSGRNQLKIDIKTGAAGTSRAIALKLGDAYAWCQSSWGWVNQDSTTTMEFDLVQDLGCASPDLSKVHAIYVWFSPGTFYIDNVRVE